MKSQTRPLLRIPRRHLPQFLLPQPLCLGVLLQTPPKLPQVPPKVTPMHGCLRSTA